MVSSVAFIASQQQHSSLWCGGVNCVVLYWVHVLEYNRLDDGLPARKIPSGIQRNKREIKEKLKRNKRGKRKTKRAKRKPRNQNRMFQHIHMYVYIGNTNENNSDGVTQHEGQHPYMRRRTLEMVFPRKKRAGIPDPSTATVRDMKTSDK